MDRSSNLDLMKYLNGGIIATVLSVINLVVFYSKFDFNALPYFEISDIIVQFIKESIVASFFVGIYFLFKKNFNRDSKIGSRYKFYIEKRLDEGRSLAKPFIAVIMIFVCVIWIVYFFTKEALIASIMCSILMLVQIIIGVFIEW